MGIPIIGDIIGGLINGAKDVVSEVVVDKDKRNQINFELDRLELDYADRAQQRLHEQMISQVEVNKVEAGSSNMFVAGWRPAVGWVGVASLAGAYLFIPIASWFARVAFEYEGTFPVLETEGMMFLLAGMLGFGGLRSWEKIKGVVEKEPEPSPPASQASQHTSTGIPVSPDQAKRMTTPRPYGQPLPEEAPWTR